MYMLSSRHVARIDLANANWQRNEHGAETLELSRDAENGAVTFALRTPPNFHYPERQHFYDCEQESFQFAGEFHHDRLLSYRQGDYVYRPVGTVYGDDEGSDDGGIFLASLARQPTRFHFDDHPKPWAGHYRIDRLWSERPEEPFLVRSADIEWSPDPTRPGCAVKPLRGTPGVSSVTAEIRRHSPGAADAALMLKISAGFRGEFPRWPQTLATEMLICAGRATINGVAWYRGCYAYAPIRGRCEVEQELELYLRWFSAGD